ncbi:benzylsuccinate CoA-transferase BbsE subunit [Prauserella shujinwangii]|uniref:Benzylsuccinate CoA-transferase BbsE subunit n=1 Tax=Prauserella shujinwangii TaxID=1453103 RepID=A0A2T0M0L5_9PSEU|nr:benzylsuccinate CoA-transferase BbsE subunit [Prauserella shujinwangii]
MGQAGRSAREELPLADIHVLDATNWLGAYAGRLLSDLGAIVTRIENPEGVPERTAGPLLPGGTSATFAFTEAGKRSVVLDPADPDYRNRLLAMLGGTDILLTSEGPEALAERGLGPEVLRGQPRLIHLAMSPFGLDGPYANRPATDLTVLAAGGLLSLAGDPDREPVRPAPPQSSVATSLHAVVGVLLALLVRDETGLGQVVDVSAQESVAHSLENAVQYVDLEGVVRRRVGNAPTEAGTGLFTCRDGWVYLVCGLGGRPLGWDGLVTWLEAEGVTAASELRDPRWSDFRWRRTAQAVAVFRELFEGFAAGLGKRELYEAGQRYGVSIAPVSTPEDLLDNPQLTERGFFRPIEVDGDSILFPGPPYRFAGLDVGPRGGPPRLGDLG